MPFRLRRDTRHWFKDVRKGLALDFDMYYLCLMAGLASSRLGPEVSSADTTELVDSFPGEYGPRGRLIIALFLSRELARRAIRLTEREALNTAIRELVDPHSASRLSERGVKLMNQYSYGGYEVLTEWFDDHPRTIETFLPLYKRKLDAAMAAVEL